MENYFILDNGGKTFDRYTLLNSSGELYGFSERPFSPNGFGQYCGDVKGNVKTWIKEMLQDGESLLSIDALNSDCQKFVFERI